MAKVFISSIINAPADTVWQTVRDFNSLPQWHPAIRDSDIEAGRPADAVGCVRSFHLQDGGHIREQLTALSDQARSMDYVILESPMPVENYLATLSVRPVTDSNSSYVEWTAEFDVPADQAEATIDTVANGVFQAGLDALKERLGRG